MRQLASGAMETRRLMFWALPLFVLLVELCYGQTTCSASKPCVVGCCGNGGLAGNAFICGTGPTFCAKGNCTTNCNYKSECDPGWGIQWSNRATCPLNVCCSPFGFCGTTADFCGNSRVVSPSCQGASTNTRTIGYYEGWNTGRKCQPMKPDQIPLGYYTHINFAFSLLDPKTFELAPMSPEMAPMYDGVARLKNKQAKLEIWLSIGGWSFNDPGPTATTFSDLARSTAAQTRFFRSLITFLVTHGYDGVDVDWEYPGADDRFGRPDDFQNLVTFLRNLKNALAATGRKYGLSITIPSSYWYMQHFDLVKISPIIDWFNIMTYDIHGTWDGNIPSIGAIALAHTNLTEIDQSLQLLWRNHIDPKKVTFGLGFYGRSFTMKDRSCIRPGCPFSGPARAGPCTDSPGTLADFEIRDIIARQGGRVALDATAGVKVVTWGGDQWVSYDDAESFKIKIDWANKRCLGGVMIWAVDLDDLNGTSIASLGGAVGRPMQKVEQVDWREVEELP